MRHMIVFILSLSCSWLKAENNFLAYQVSGSVQYRENDQQYQLKIGKILSGNQTILVAKNAKLVLICENSSRAVTLQEGVYELKKLSDVCMEPDHSALGGFLKFVWWQFTHPRTSPEEERKKMMETWSGVFRGCPGMEVSPLLDTVCYYQSGVLLRWHLTGPYKKKEFRLYQNETGPLPVTRIPLRKDQYPLDKLKTLMQPSLVYYWSVNVDGQEPCPRKVIEVWSKYEFHRLTDTLRSYFLPGLDEAEKDYTMGYFLETNHFYGEAYRYYRKAAASKPGESRYNNTLARCKQLFDIRK